MSTIAGHLRATREELAPTVAELAPGLIVDELTIWRAIHRSLERQGVSPDAVSELNWNKTERHVIAGWGIGEIRQRTVDGDGFGATFKEDILPATEDGDGGGSIALVNDVRSALSVAKIELRGLPVWPALERRYKALGERAVSLAGESTIPHEGRELDTSLGIGALEPITYRYLAFISEKVTGSKSEREAAMRDLIYLPYGLAAHHVLGFTEIIQSLEDPWGKIKVTQEKGRYRAKTAKGRPFTLPIDWAEDADGATLMCAAMANGHLKALTGATINAVPLYKVFG